MCQRPCYQTACWPSFIFKLHSFCLRLPWGLPIYAITLCPYSSPVFFLFFFSLLEVLVQISLHTWQSNLGPKETEPLVELSVLRVILVHHPFMVSGICSAFRSTEHKMPNWDQWVQRGNLSQSWVSFLDEEQNLEVLAFIHIPPVNISISMFKLLFPYLKLGFFLL